MANNSSQMPTPKMPAPPQPQRPPPGAKTGPAVNHPAVAEYVSQWNTMAHELDRLRIENRQLQYDLDCARQMITELQHISDHERAKKETYQRWATRFDTMAGEIASLAGVLRDEAARAAQPEPVAQQIEGDTAQHAQDLPEGQVVEDSIAAMAKKFAPKTDGAAHYGKTAG